MTLPEAIARAVQVWSGEGIGLLPPASAAAVRTAVGDLGQRPRADVETLYTTVGGFAVDGSWDKHLWALWSLERVRQRNLPGTAGVVFSDFLISSHEYQFRYEDEGRSSVWMF